MKMNELHYKFCVGVFSALIGCAAQADAIRVSMTVDNSYALFVGDINGASRFIGSDNSWSSVEQYNFILPSTAYLYVVTASDLSVAQGFLGQFENLTSGYKFYSQDPQWQVMSTGLGAAAPYTDSASDLALLTREIQQADVGSTPSGGWTNFTAGGLNGTSPWGTMAGIDAAARWVWYAGGNCNSANPTLGGCDAGEWLAFRIAVAATPTDPTPGAAPEPTSLALAGVGLAAASWARRNRSLTRRKASFGSQVDAKSASSGSRA